MLARVTNWQWILVFAMLGVLTHFVAWPIVEPRRPVFDEQYYGQEVIVYLGEPKVIFDIHPPHAKMMTALVVKALGFDPRFEISKRGETAPDFPLWKFRFLPALCGILIPVLFFVLARLLGFGGLAAPLAGIGLCLDNAFLSHTRLLTIDGQILVYALGAFIAYVLSRERRSLGWVVLAGVLSGLAFGTKFTGLAVGGFLFLAYAVREKSWRRTLLFSVAGLGTYLGGWWLSFHLLNVRGDFFDQLVSFHGEMLAFNTKQQPWHYSSSQWWSWPFGGRGIWLFQAETFLCEMANPLFWIVTFVFFVLGVKEAWAKKDRERGFWISAYLVSFVPFMFIGRYMFLYHYFLPFVISLLVAVAWLDRRLTARRFWDGVIVMTITFLLISPLTYSFPDAQGMRLALLDHLPHFW